MRQEAQLVWSSRYRKGAVANAVVSAVWTLLYVIPVDPFPMLLRIVVAGGPGTWFILSYLLYIIVGFGGFLGLSYLYFVAERFEGRVVNRGLALVGFLAMYVGLTGTTFGLAVAGALGGYAAVIAHSPAETVRLIMEPFVNPLRTLCLVTVVGAVASLAAPYVEKHKTS
ncbi:MAG: hypothetical protein QW470_03975 [Candidatus Caldarchaeum sp.]